MNAADGEAILAFVAGRSRAAVRAGLVDPLDLEQQARYEALVKRRELGEPLAYVLGSAGFYRREFLVDPRVLIPRPETEHLCETAIAFLQQREAPRALDVGTGSGAIACTLAAEVETAHVDAVDTSAAALEVAAENRKRLHLEHRISLFYGDLLEPVAGKRYDAVIANLPYVPEGEGDVDLRFEPASALYGGADGLDVYRRFFAQVPPAVKPGGIVLAEGAPPIAAGLLALAQAAFPHARVTLERDYGGRDRYVKAETPG